MSHIREEEECSSRRRRCHDDVNGSWKAFLGEYIKHTTIADLQLTQVFRRFVCITLLIYERCNGEIASTNICGELVQVSIQFPFFSNITGWVGEGEGGLKAAILLLFWVLSFWEGTRNTYGVAAAYVRSANCLNCYSNVVCAASWNCEY